MQAQLELEIHDQALSQSPAFACTTVHSSSDQIPRLEINVYFIMKYLQNWVIQLVQVAGALICGGPAKKVGLSVLTNAAGIIQPNSVRKQQKICSLPTSKYQLPHKPCLSCYNLTTHTIMFIKIPILYRILAILDSKNPTAETRHLKGKKFSYMPLRFILLGANRLVTLEQSMDSKNLRQQGEQ